MPQVTDHLLDVLKALRWKPDMVVVNDFGETVWLKECYHEGKRIGITDCCEAADPCDWHKALAESPPTVDVCSQ